MDELKLKPKQKASQFMKNIFRRCSPIDMYILYIAMFMFVSAYSLLRYVILKEETFLVKIS